MTTLTTLDVTGMTCGHCVSAVTTELERVEGVKNVSVELHSEGASEVTVLSDAPLEESVLRAAVDEAGYEVAGVAAQTAEEARAETGEASSAAAAEAFEQVAHSCGCGGSGCGGGAASSSPEVIELGARQG